MGFSFRKSIKIGPARINLSKSGVGYSVGAGGLRYTKSPKKKSSSKKAASKKATSSTGRPSIHSSRTFTESRIVKRSWPMAIIIPLIGFVIVGGVSFIATFLCYAIASIFVKDLGTAVDTKLFVTGIPVALALATAIIAFLRFKPLKGKNASKDIN